MSGIDASKVLVGAPQQTAVSGAVARAPLGTSVPTKASDVLGSAFIKGGYVSDEGISVTPEYSTTDIRDWSQSLVRRVLESFTGTIAFAFIQNGINEAKMIFGEDNVIVTSPTLATGNQVNIALNGKGLPPAGVWVFSMKDGDNLIKIVAPNAQPTTLNELKFLPTEAIEFGTELACYPDSQGNSIYILTDDGVFAGTVISVIESITGEPDPAGTGDLVTLEGSHFSGVTSVKIGATEATDFTVVNDSQIVAILPSGSAGTVDVVVVSPAGTSAAFAYTRAA